MNGSRLRAIQLRQMKAAAYLGPQLTWTPWDWILTHICCGHYLPTINKRTGVLHKGDLANMTSLKSFEVFPHAKCSPPFYISLVLESLVTAVTYFVRESWCHQSWGPHCSGLCLLATLFLSRTYIMRIILISEAHGLLMCRIVYFNVLHLFKQ